MSSLKLTLIKLGRVCQWKPECEAKHFFTTTKHNNNNNINLGANHIVRHVWYERSKGKRCLEYLKRINISQELLRIGGILNQTFCILICKPSFNWIFSFFMNFTFLTLWKHFSYLIEHSTQLDMIFKQSALLQIPHNVLSYHEYR